jgi:hypothetical protein
MHALKTIVIISALSGFDFWAERFEFCAFEHICDASPKRV